MATDKKRIVVKVGTSSLTYANGKANIRHIDRLVQVLSDIINSGSEVLLVTSGAIGMGIGKMNLKERPKDTPAIQALSTIGQCELMFLYDKYFSEYNHPIGQILITKTDIEDAERCHNLINTIEQLLQQEAVPIINENDCVGIEEIVFGDNDCLSSYVACLVKADLLIILTDTEGLYDSDPTTDPQARLIPFVEKITPELHTLAGGTVSGRGTGGMITKLRAAEKATAAGITTYIINGNEAGNIYKAIDGEQIGTCFKGR